MVAPSYVELGGRDHYPTENTTDRWVIVSALGCIINDVKSAMKEKFIGLMV